MHALMTLDPSKIKQFNGLYCLNDLHKMAGGLDKDQPNRFLRLEKTKELIKAISKRQNQTKAEAPEMVFGQVFSIVHGGKMRGIYGNRKIVYAYAMWVDPYFYDMVLEVFDMVAGNFDSLTDQLNHIITLSNKAENAVSHAGYILCVGGKQTKPNLAKLQKTLLNQIQPQLPLDGGNHEA